MHFPSPEKSLILGEMVVVVEKSRNFILSKYFVLFENWKHFPCHRAKICSNPPPPPKKKAGFSASFSSRRKIKLVMEKSWKTHWILLPNFVVSSISVSEVSYIWWQLLPFLFNCCSYDCWVNVPWLTMLINGNNNWLFQTIAELNKILEKVALQHQDMESKLRGNIAEIRPNEAQLKVRMLQKEVWFVCMR